MSSKSIRRKSTLQRAVVETLDKRVLLSGTPHDYVWKEAENYDAAENATDGHYWDLSSQSGFSGSGVQAKERDKVKYEFGDAANSARLDYTANFAQAGKYYVWVRGIGFDGNSDSVHIGINGQPALSAGNIAVRREGVLWSTFSTENALAGFITVPSAGTHTINLFMREAGTSVDAIMLTTDKAFRPEATFDLDVDSDNNDATSAPARTQEEDDVEDFENDPAKPGKIIAVNNTDLDSDGVPDWGDGFNADGNVGNADNMPPTAAQGMSFAPILFSMSKGVDLTKAKLRLSYSASDPAEVEPTLESGAAGYRMSPEGALRLWTKNGFEERKKGAFNEATPGHYVPPTSEGEYGAADFTKLGFTTTQRDVTLYIEVVAPSLQWGEQAIIVEIDPDGDGPAGFVANDRVRVTGVTADADLDSDNTGGASGNPSGSSLTQDQTEAQEKDAANKRLLGKVVLVNDGDLDGDGVLDYSDGFNADGTAGNLDDAPPTTAQGGRFTPFVITVPDPIDVTKARLQIDYDASVPGTGPGGSLRLWTKDGSTARSKNVFTAAGGGDYVPKRVGTDFFSSTDLAILGLTNGARSKTLFIEGIAPSSDAGDKLITVRIDPDGDGPAGFIAADVVRLTTIRVDLDVDGNKSLNDVSDGTVNYLPGYEGTTAKVSTGATFNTAAYVGQQMRLMVQGLGSGTVLDSITFKIVDVTNLAGYTGNASDPKVEGTGKDEDFSFAELANADPANGRKEAGAMEAGKTTVPFWAKDYGGWAKIKVEAKIGTSAFTLREFTISNDSDGDKIADKWEREKVTEWNTQYGETEVVSPAFFDDQSDKELKDPDGTTDALGFTALPTTAPAGATDGFHASIGDGRKAIDEYRGFLMDGGGFDWAGANGHAGGHVRLNPAYKELLVEVDAMDGVAALPATTRTATITGWMDAVAKGTSQTADGAGFRTYYLLEDMATAHQASFATMADAKTYIDGGRTFVSFTHLHLVDELGTWGSGGQSWSDRQTMVGIDTLKSYHPIFFGNPAPAWSPTFDGFVISYVSHELHHTYAWNAPGGGAHVDDTNGNGTDDEASDFEYVLYNYYGAPNSYKNQDYSHVRYGRGTTRYIDIR
jgi:hypothetical protein